MSDYELSEANVQRIQLIQEHYNLDWFRMDPSGLPVFLGTDNNRRCRFCGKVEPKTTFEKIAHAIPELLGNRTLCSSWECDSCNRWFGKNYDDQFGRYTHPARTLGQTCGKKGVPSIKLGRSWIDFTPETGLQIYKHPKDNCIQIDANAKCVRFKKTREPYRPRSVYKCLVKMALAIMPESEISHFAETINWLMVEPDADTVVTSSFCCHSWFMAGAKPIPYPWAVLGVKKDDDPISLYPYAFFFLAFDNLAYQIVVPFCSLDKHLEGKKAKLITFPDPLDSCQTLQAYRSPERTRLDLSSNEFVRDNVWEYTLRYNGRCEREPSDEERRYVKSRTK